MVKSMTPSPITDGQIGKFYDQNKSAFHQAGISSERFQEILKRGKQLKTQSRLMALLRELDLELGPVSPSETKMNGVWKTPERFVCRIEVDYQAWYNPKKDFPGCVSWNRSFQEPDGEEIEDIRTSYGKKWVIFEFFRVEVGAGLPREDMDLERAAYGLVRDEQAQFVANQVTGFCVEHPNSVSWRQGKDRAWFMTFEHEEGKICQKVTPYVHSSPSFQWFGGVRRRDY